MISARTAGIAGAILVAGAAIVLLLPGMDRVAEAFWRGSLGTGSALVSGTLVRAVPLMILGVALSLAFRAGAFNIGGEGQLLLGGVAAVVVCLRLTPSLGAVALPAALVAAMLAGALWAGIAGVLRARFGVLEVISTIMLNFVAMNLVAYLVRGPLQEPLRIYPQTETIADVVQLPRLIPGTRLHLGIVVALCVAAASWWFLARTAAGFRLRATGASAEAARVTGRVDVGRTTILAMALSGALAGLAGGIEVTGVTFALYENLSPGYGFSAIAVAILARLNPLAVIPSALLFAILETGALGMQRDAGVPSTLVLALEAAAILIVVAVHGFWRGGVPALGRSVPT